MLDLLLGVGALLGSTLARMLVLAEYFDAVTTALVDDVVRHDRPTLMTSLPTRDWSSASASRAA